MDKILQIAKLTAPSLGKVYNRTRLFRVIDEAHSKKQALWISAAGGSGKTTLVASYAQKKKVPLAWYKMDEGDQDVASFFHFLSKLDNVTKALPVLTPEYAFGIAVFARNFFRQLAEGLPHPGMLVFDNVQHVPADSPLHTVLAVAAEELPQDILPIFISRQSPPPAYSRLLISENMPLISEEEMAVNLDETKAIARLLGYKNHSEEYINNILSINNGWMTGVVLMLRQQQLPNMSELDNSHVLYHYFTTELFQALSEESRHLLLSTCLLGQFTINDAISISGLDTAQSIIEQLINNNTFMTADKQIETSFEYHPLFREFLLIKSNDYFAEEQLIEKKLTAANLLLAKGMAEEAADILIELQQWEPLVNLVIQYAPQYVGAGRFATLAHIIGALPDQIFEQISWMRFWQAVSFQASDLEKSRECYQLAFEAFKKEEDAVGAYMSWAGAIDTYLYIWSEFQTLDYWIDQFYVINNKWPEFPTPDIQGRVTFGMFTALMWRQPDHKDFPTWRSATEAMLNLDIDPNQRMMMGVYLLFYYIWWQGNLGRADVIVQTVKPIAAKNDIGPLARVCWKYVESAYSAATDNYSGCIKAVEEGLQIAADSGVYVMNLTLHSKAVYGALAEGEYEVAQSHLNEMAPLLHEKAYFDQAHYHYLTCWLALITGDIHKAEKHAQKGLELSQISLGAICCPFLSLTMAQVLQEIEQYESAETHMGISREWADRVDCANIECHDRFNKAYLHIVKGRERALPEFDLLKQAFEYARTHNFVSHPWIVWRKDVMQALCIKALEKDIETEFVTKLIKSKKLAPVRSVSLPENWPWQLKIYTMGRFSIVINNKPLEIKGKAQYKLLELLKVIISLGGRDVAFEEVTDIVWPDSEGDAASSALHTNLSRLRKLLGDDKFITLHNRRISLNDQYVWVDLWSIQRTLSTVNQQLDQMQSGAGNIEGLVEKLLAYKGDYLEGENTSWVIMLREQVHNKWLSCVRKVGKYLLQNTQWQALSELYQSAFDIDPLSEDLCQVLMQAYYNLGLQSDVRRVYSQCEKQLNHVFQISPSHETKTCFSRYTSTDS